MNHLARKRFLRAFILTLLTLLVTLGCSQTTQFLAPAVPLKPPVQAEWPTLETSTIDIADVVYTLRGKPQKEFDDQLRDWAVYGRLTQMGLDKETFAKATYRMVPIRLEYLHDAFMFDYGRGRRAIVGDNDVLLFYDKSDPDRVKTLGHLADRVRMEIGEIPAEFQVFEVAPDVTRGLIHLSRKASIPGSEMFSPAYGYFEQSVSGLNDFKSWLDSIDDVTYAQMKDGQLQLGGRRSLQRRTPGVTVEDVAVLVQAHQALGQGHREHEDKVDRVKAELERDYKAALADPRYDRAQVESEYQSILAKIEEHSGFKDTPGFSLDPQWNLNGLAKKLDRLAMDPCSEVGSAIRILKSTKTYTPADAIPLRVWKAAELVGVALEQTKHLRDEYRDPRVLCTKMQAALGSQFSEMAHAVRSAMDETDTQRRMIKVNAAMQPLWQMRNDALSDTESLVDALVEFVRASHQVQCARYDGPLQGTRVGMTLFYADLLAKLWQLDYHHSAPSLAVSGFLSGPRMNLGPQWKEELARSPYTRLWFGPKQTSYATSADDETLWFEHIGTRVFAAGSDPAKPGEETQPAESSRRTLGWWDRHYSDVADYEPQYHVQNQIIKWSILTGWKQDAFSFLENVETKTDYRFDRWYQSEKPGLRYQHPIQLRPSVSDTECVDLLASYPFPNMGSVSQLSGGVSLGGKSALKIAPRISVDVPRSLRFVVPDRQVGPGTAARVVPRYESGGAVVELGGTRTRTPTKDLHLKRVEVSFEKTTDAEVRVAVRSDRSEIGTLRATLPSEKVVKFELERPGIVSREVVEAADVPELLRDAGKKLTEGDAPAAAPLYELARKTYKLPPEEGARQAVAQVLSGQSEQGLKNLGDLKRLPAAVAGALPPSAKERLDGLLQVARALKENDTSPTIIGVPANRMRVVADGIDVRSSVRLANPLEVEDVPFRERGKVLADRDTVIYVQKGAFGNRHDVEAAGNGFYAATAKMPNVGFKQMRAKGRSYAPDEVVTPDGTVYVKLPSQAGAGSMAMVALATTAVFIYLENRCDSNGDGSVSDEERKACGIR